MNGVSYNKNAILDKGEPRGNVAFLWCPVADTVDNYQFGLSVVIYSKSTCIIYDFGNDTDAGSVVLNFLNNNNIHKVDAVVISHFHGDHARTASVQKLLESNVDTSSTVFYFPHKNIDWNRISSDLPNNGMYKAFTGIRNLAQTYNLQIVYPDTEGYEVKIGEWTCNFYNVDSSLFTDYYSWTYGSRSGIIKSTYPRYNNFSMCMNIKIASTNIFLTGDVEKPAQANLDGVACNADILQIPHHGVNLIESELFVNSISSKVSVLSPYSYLAYPQLNNALSPITNKCKECGTVLTTRNEIVKFEIYKDDFDVVHTNSDITGMYIGAHLLENGDLNDAELGLTIASNVTTESGAGINSTIANMPLVFNRTAYFYTIPLNQNSSDSYPTLIQFGYCSSNIETSADMIDKHINRPQLMVRQRNGQGDWTHWFHVNLPFQFSGNDTDILSLGSGTYRVNRLYGSQKIAPSSIMGDLTAEVTDCNTAIYTGIYKTTPKASNRPITSDSLFYILTFSYQPSTNKRQATQIAWSYGSSITHSQGLTLNYYRTVYARKYSEGNTEKHWTDWYKLPMFRPSTEPERVPDPPTQDGTYTLKCTVSNGSPVFSWST